mgnify:FL=1
MKLDRTSIFTINSERSLSTEIMGDYSRMKYGDPRATRLLGSMLYAKFISYCGSNFDVSQSDGIILTSSAFGSVPTAAHALTNEFGLMLKSKEVNFDRVRITRSQNVADKDYSKLDYVQRGNEMNVRRLTLSDRYIDKLNGRPLVVIDDLYATGRHEQAIVDLLRSVAPDQRVLFIYIF